MSATNDNLGHMTHYTRFAGTIRTEYRPEGYYWSHINGEWVGPFPTRAEAKAHELATIQKRAKRRKSK